METCRQRSLRHPMGTVALLRESPLGPTRSQALQGISASCLFAPLAVALHPALYVHISISTTRIRKQQVSYKPLSPVEFQGRHQMKSIQDMQAINMLYMLLSHSYMVSSLPH